MRFWWVNVYDDLRGCTFEMYLWSIFSILYITKAVSKHSWLIYVFPHFTLSENHLFCFHILSKEFKFPSSLIVCLSVTQYRHPVHLSSFDWNEHAYLNQHKSIYNTFQYQIWKWYIFSLNSVWRYYMQPLLYSSS